MRWTRAIAVALLLLTAGAGCEDPPAPAEAPPAPAETAEKTKVPLTPAPKAPEQVGVPVSVGPAHVLHRSDSMRVERQAWTFDGVKGTAWRIRLPRRTPFRVPSNEHVVPFASLLPAKGSWAAINGGFYEVDPDRKTHDYRPMGLVVTDGKAVSKLTRRGGSGVLYLDKAGAHVVHRDQAPKAPRQALQSIDRLVDKGKSVVARREGQKGAARTAFVLEDDALWLIIAVADEDIEATPTGATLSKSGTGLTLWAFAEYLLDTTKPNEALNLDGGISTQIAAKDGEFQLMVRGVSGTMNAIVVGKDDT